MNPHTYYSVTLIKPVCYDVGACVSRGTTCQFMFHRSPHTVHARTQTWRREEEGAARKLHPNVSKVQGSAGREAPLVKASTIFLLMSCSNGSDIVATHLSFHQYLLRQKKKKRRGLDFKLSIVPLEISELPTLTFTHSNTHRHEHNGFISNASHEKYNTVTDTLLPKPLVRISF